MSALAIDHKLTFVMKLVQLGPSANDRGHWAKRHRQGRDVRDATISWARGATNFKVFDWMDAPATLQYTVIWPKGKRRLNDGDNLLGQLKACTDGIKAAGLIHDDAPAWLTLLPVEQVRGTDPLGAIHVKVELSWRH